ncbi:MAG: DUF438 domain-containing protein [bacterium]|nr:DUF438 domain-containing protein [bacterium]
MRPQLVRLLGRVPYDEVVEVEQELINEGLPAEEVLKLCDIHTQALRGAIDDGGDKDVPAGHPVDVFQKENKALAWAVSQLEGFFEELQALPEGADPQPLLHDIRVRFNALMDVEKHYLRKDGACPQPWTRSANIFEPLPGRSVVSSWPGIGPAGSSPSCRGAHVVVVLPPRV